MMLAFYYYWGVKNILSYKNGNGYAPRSLQTLVMILRCVE